MEHKISPKAEMFGQGANSEDLNVLTENELLARAQQAFSDGDGTRAAQIALKAVKKHDSAVAKTLLEQIFTGQSHQRPMGTTLGQADETAIGKQKLDEQADDEVWWWVSRGMLGLALTLLVMAGVSAAAPPSVSVAMLCPLCYVVFIATLAACCRIHNRYKRFQPGVTIPVISELGIFQPGTVVYQGGFTMVGLLLALSMRRFDELVSPQLQDAEAAAVARAQESRLPPPSLEFAIKAGYAAAAGAALQGLCTLEMKASLQTLVHFGGAMLFMAGAFQHAQSIEPIYSEATNPTVEALFFQRYIAVQWAHTLRHWMLHGAVPIMCFVLPLAFQVYSFVFPRQTTVPKSTGPVARQQSASGSQGQCDGGTEPEMQPDVANAMGAMQWAIIFLFATYFATYTADLYAACSDTPSCMHPPPGRGKSLADSIWARYPQ